MLFCDRVCFLRLVLGDCSIRIFKNSTVIPIMNPLSWFMIYLYLCTLCILYTSTHALLSYETTYKCTGIYVLFVVDLSAWKSKLESGNVDTIDAVDSMGEESSDDDLHDNNSSVPAAQCSGNVLCVFSVIDVTVYV